MKRLILLLALVLLLCACSETPPPAETAPPQTAAPTETVPETTAPPETTPPETVLEDFSEYEALLAFSAEPNWLARSLGCLFENPYEVDLHYMFYLGVDHPGSWGDISEESRQTLLEAGFIEEMDLQIMPAEKLEEALMSTFGIDLKYVAMPEDWCYIYNEDAFCSNHSDAYFPGVPTITAVDDDGTTVVIHYTIEGYWNPKSYAILDYAHLVMTLQRQEDGTCRAVSNLLES